MAVLRIVSGRAEFVEYELDRAMVIGRGEDCDIRIFDETSSRRHAEVLPEGEGALLRDKGSSNGTLFKGERVSEATLSDGDEFLVGSTRFRLVLASQNEKGTVILEGDADEGLSVHSSIAEKEFQVIGGDPTADYTRLSRAFETGRSLSGIRELKDLVTKITDLLKEELQADRAAVLRDLGTGDVEVIGGRKRRDKKSLVLSRTVVRQVSSERKAVLIRDTGADPRFRDQQSILSQKVRSALCVPLAEGGDLLGMLYADRTKSDDPFDRDDLEALLTIATQVGPALRNAEAFALERDRLRDIERSLGGGARIVGQSKAFRKILDLVNRAADSDSTVLLKGETGTGKELLARAVHEGSPRNRGPFIAVNCAALVDTLLESELFGHEKGAFTGATGRKPGKFELAQGGSLFLDEVGEMPLEMQAKLLRALQEREFYRVGGTHPVSVDIRIVAATNKDLAQEVEAGRFRQDLFYRISVVTIDVPPLRERRDDIPPLVDRALSLAAGKIKRKLDGVAPDALEALCAYRWPGNIRELMNVIERAVVLSPGPRIGIDLLPLEVRGGSSRPESETGVMTLKEAECRAIENALAHTGWKKGETAELLGTSWPTLNKKIQEYGLKKPGS